MTENTTEEEYDALVWECVAATNRGDALALECQRLTNALCAVHVSVDRRAGDLLKTPPFVNDLEINAWTHGVVAVLGLLREEVENHGRP